MSDIPKSLGINPRACTPEGIAKNFENIVREITNNDSSMARPVRFRLTENLDTGGNAAAVIVTFDGSAYGTSDVIQVFDFQGLSPNGSAGRGMWHAATGAEGWAVRREESAVQGRAEYDILWMETYARGIEFELTSTFTAGVADATVTASWDQGIEPGTPLEVHDDNDNFTGASIGDKGTALRSEYADPNTSETPYYKVIYLPPTSSVGGLVRFKLTADLTTGASAAAVLRTWTGAAYADGSAIVVHDWNGASNGLRGMWHAASGAEGWARRREDDTDYEIVWMEQTAQAIEFVLTSTFSAGVATASVLASWEQGLEPGASLDVHDDNNNFADAAVGDKGTALRSEYAAPGTPGTPYYKVVYLPPGASSSQQPIRFRLTADLVTGGSAAAVIRTWNGAAYVNGAAISVSDWWAISLGGRGMNQGVANMEGWARRVEGEDDEYDIIWMESYAREVEFTLTGDLFPGFTSAVVTASWCQGVEPGENIVVYDDTDTFNDAIEGCKGRASRSEYADANQPEFPYYKVTRCQRVVERGSAVLFTKMCGDDPLLDEESWEAAPHGEESFDPGQPDDDDIVNDALRQARAGDIIWIERIDDTPPFQWRVYDVTRHPYESTNRVYVEDDCLKRKYLPDAAKETCEDEIVEELICWEDCAVEEEE